jgi:hypothetical protein
MTTKKEDITIRKPIMKPSAVILFKWIALEKAILKKCRS